MGGEIGYGPQARMAAPLTASKYCRRSGSSAKCRVSPRIGRVRSRTLTVNRVSLTSQTICVSMPVGSTDITWAAKASVSCAPTRRTCSGRTPRVMRRPTAMPGNSRRRSPPSTSNTEPSCATPVRKFIIVDCEVEGDLFHPAWMNGPGGA